MRSRLLVVLVAVLVPLLLSAEELFTSPELNVSVAQLPFEKSWAMLPGDGRLLATSESGEQFTIWASPDPVAVVDDRWVAALLRTAAKHAAASGSRIEAVRISRASRPVAQSFHFAYTIVGRSGERTLVDGYTAAAGRAYVLQYVSRDRRSQALFQSLVSSFRVHDKLESYRGGGAKPAPPVSAIMLSAPVGRAIAPNTDPPVTGPRQ
jgi:hypothetical protein